MKRFFIMFFGLVFLMIPVLAQGDSEVPVIPDVEYLIANFGILMLTFTGIAAVASFIAEFFIRILKSTKKWIKIALVLFFSVALSFLSGLLFKEGDYAIMVWWQKILWGLLSGAAAAGIRDHNLLFLKSVVEFVIGLLLKKEPKE